MDLFSGSITLHDVLNTDISILSALKNAKIRLRIRAEEEARRNQEKEVNNRQKNENKKDNSKKPRSMTAVLSKTMPRKK